MVMPPVWRVIPGRIAVLALLGQGCGRAAAPPAPAAMDAGALRAPNPTCLAPPAAVPQGTAGLPAHLAETGCFDPVDPTQPVAALVPYTVAVSLWSDGAEKDRWLALPDGARIDLRADGDLDLPPGSVLIKTFRLGERRVETRFFVRHADGAHSGYTYAWNDAGTDAELLDEGSHDRPIGDVMWHFPSRAECDKCHTKAAGFSLGLELAQLDHGDQLDRMAARDLFARPLPLAALRPAPLPDPADPALPTDTRARAYLHANCANCHRPGVGNSGTTDLRFTTSLGATATCAAEPLKGSLGYGADFRIVAPGDPDRSMVIVRMRELASGRMPPIASRRVDSAGLALVADWIRALPGCE
jgi:uncharacterized repeat protein (TIGR03806 family)